MELYVDDMMIFLCKWTKISEFRRGSIEDESFFFKIL